ncbi:late embryogenesis abundant protein 1-like [Diospyros lotus]|uniref:late embryogenesis abundant protein 1-like n=1 Tax=Diospyros lotus TaxID=55363 RepID=UPI00225479F7|nr:late embryogenesis abundant protein 1-like [Diospyros lotus]
MAVEDPVQGSNFAPRVTNLLACPPYIYLQLTSLQFISKADNVLEINQRKTYTTQRPKSVISQEKMSSSQFSAGQTHGQARAKTEDLVQSAQSTANAASEKLADSGDSAQQHKEEAAGFIQQTGEQVVQMAQGAIDGVKNTLGINEKK